MTAIAIDTLKSAWALRDIAYFSPEQAEGTAEALAEAMPADSATHADLTRANITGDARRDTFGVGRYS
jgi:hypothetical protein